MKTLELKLLNGVRRITYTEQGHPHREVTMPWDFVHRGEKPYNLVYAGVELVTTVLFDRARIYL